MDCPVLNHALVLESPEKVPDGSGGFVQLWAVQGTLWARIEARSGRETAHFGAPVSRASYRITVRGAPWGNPDRPRPQQRFRDGTRIFTIVAVVERDSKGRYLVCYAEEEVVV